MVSLGCDTTVVPVLLSPSFTTGIGIVTGMNVKPGNDAVPPAVVISKEPDAPLPTIAVILEEETTLNEVALMPPKLTNVADMKLLPVMVTVEPVVALAGVKETMVGKGINVNPPNVAVPPGVVTATLPEVPLATTAEILLADTTVKDAADVPPNVTAVAPVKLLPLMITALPLPALVGVNWEMVAVGM